MALSQPVRLQRNLWVVESAADQGAWRVPFRLGNPKAEPASLVLRVDGETPAGVDVLVLVNGQGIQAGQPIPLGARDEADAQLVILAHRAPAGDIVRSVEATIGGQFVDGIQVAVRRPASPRSSGVERPAHGVAEREPVAALT